MDEAAQPVRNAIVTITASGLTRGRSVVTDEEGRFAFANLPASRYTVTASKASYVTTAYGAKRPGRQGTVVEVATDRSVQDLTVRLARGAVITGRVTDGAGQPLSFIAVTAIPAGQAAGSAATALSDETFETDDRGMYRIFGLAPGTYYVAASPRESAGSVEALSSSDVDAIFARLRDERTAPPTAPAAPPIDAPSPEPALALILPIFFPGTATVEDAGHVTLAIAEERSGIDIAVELVRSHAIDGVVVGGDGVPPESIGLAIVSAGPALPGPPRPMGVGSRPTLSVRPGADGRFRLTGVPPGTHTLVAWTTTTTAPQPGGRGGAPTAQLVASLYASADVPVRNDVAGVVLTLQPVASFTGRVVFAGNSAPPPDLTRLRITLTPATATATPMPLNGIPPGALIRQASALVTADGRFEIPNVMPNIYRLALPIPGSTPGSGWWLRSAIAGGRDLLDTSFDARVAVADAVLTFTDRHTELTGTLQTPAGQPASDYFIITFTTDRSLWKPQARRLQSTRPGTDGAFSFKDLPPGEYFLAALTDIDQDEWQDPAFLSDVAATGAIRITIGEGEKTVQDLRIIGR